MIMGFATESPAMRSFDVLVEQDEEGWFVAQVVQLPGCVTQARTMDELKANVKEAIELFLEEDGAQSPNHFVGLMRVEVNG